MYSVPMPCQSTCCPTSCPSADYDYQLVAHNSKSMLLQTSRLPPCAIQNYKEIKERIKKDIITPANAPSVGVVDCQTVSLAAMHH